MRSIAVGIVFFISSVSFLGCHSKENLSQPDLFNYEKSYFSRLERKYGCKIDRTLNEHYLKEDIKREFAHYEVVLRELPDTFFLIGDSGVRSIGQDIARTLHEDVLTSYPYAYETLDIGFDSPDGNLKIYTFYFSNSRTGKSSHRTRF